jgi:acetyl-CoA acyltransferase
MESTYGVESMGHTAENICQQMKISRADQDQFALHSQLKASRALVSKRFAKEILPISIPHPSSSKKSNKEPSTIFETDEFIKPHTTMEVLSKLKPVFSVGGTVTAGSSSGLNDGAGCLLLASEEEIQKYNLDPLARIVSSAAVGCLPSVMGLGPVRAADIALQKANLTWSDIEIIEINEAFAGQAIGCLRSWNLHEQDERVNPNGGAIALGHPLGMSGIRIALTAAIELQEKKAKYALVSMCVGVGQGVALIIERC